MAESEEEQNTLLMKVKEESEKTGLKLNIQKTKIMASGPVISLHMDGETMETVTNFVLGGSKITADGDCSHEIKRRLLLARKAMTELDSILKSRDITLPTKVHRQGYGFSSSHVWMWELDHKESWMPKNWCFWTSVVLEKTQESLGLQGDPTSPSKGNQFGIFTGRTDAEAETPILWPPDEKNWLTGKDPDAGKDWRQEEKGTTEDEVVGWHHQLDGHEFEQAVGVGNDGFTESDFSERLNWTDPDFVIKLALWNACDYINYMS